MHHVPSFVFHPEICICKFTYFFEYGEIKVIGELRIENMIIRNEANVSAKYFRNLFSPEGADYFPSIEGFVSCRQATFQTITYMRIIVLSIGCRILELRIEKLLAKNIGKQKKLSYICIYFLSVTHFVRKSANR